MTEPDFLSTNNRPYRSHKWPACDRCRKRKIRCNIDIPNQPCLACRERRLDCQFNQDHQTRQDGKFNIRYVADEQSGNVNTPKRPRLDDAVETAADISSSNEGAGDQNLSDGKSANIIVGPAVAEDVEILHKHLSTNASGNGKRSKHYQTLSSEFGNPIIYLAVPKSRPRYKPAIGVGESQKEVIEQILGPLRFEVTKLYLFFVHTHFSVVSTDLALKLQEGKLDHIPPALLCVVYAISLPWWHRSDSLKLHPRPDIIYIWNQAVSAVQDDFASPAISTIAAASIDLIGRPSLSIIGNIGLSARTVGLAQAFGLHRDPSTWNIKDDKKNSRVRLWWGVLINDYWSALAYGTPPHIMKGSYDVPLPTTKVLLPDLTSSKSFIELCSLSEILGEVLPLVYVLKPNIKELSETVNRLEVELDHWEAHVPEGIQQSWPASTGNQSGYSHLWFCFLSVKLLLSRLTCRTAILRENSFSKQSFKNKLPRIDNLRDSAINVVDFVCSLKEVHYNEFWLPYTVHTLVSATMILLRCTLETSDIYVRSNAIAKMQDMKAKLKQARDHYEWEIADYYLERCSEPISQVARFVDSDMPVQDQAGGVTALNEADAMLPEFFDPMGFDLSWDALWDPNAGMFTYPT